MIEQIRANLKTAAEGISGIGTVKFGRAPRADALPKLPGLWIGRADIESEDDGVPLRHVRRIAHWPVSAIAETEDELEDLVRGAVEAFESDQSLGGLGFLQDSRGRAVLVEAIDIQETTAVVSRNIFPAMVTVRTIYLSAQGEL